MYTHTCSTTNLYKNVDEVRLLFTYVYHTVCTVGSTKHNVKFGDPPVHVLLLIQYKRSGINISTQAYRCTYM